MKLAIVSEVERFPKVCLTLKLFQILLVVCLVAIAFALPAPAPSQDEISSNLAASNSDTGVEDPTKDKEFLLKFFKIFLLG